MSSRPDYVSKARGAAVAAVLVVGCTATIATTPPLEDCPNVASEVEVSDFYGSQEVDSGAGGYAEPKDVTAHGYTLEHITVSIPGCVAQSASVPVGVRLDFEQDGTGEAPEDVFASFQVEDATGRTWHDPDPGVGEARPARDGVRAYPAYAYLVFDLPLDVQSPVVLLLGDLADEDLDRLVLDPAGTGAGE